MHVYNNDIINKKFAFITHKKYNSHCKLFFFFGVIKLERDVSCPR